MQSPPPPPPPGTSGPDSGTPPPPPAAEEHVCNVCTAKLERTHLHFGAFACNSCRAFFRRIHKDSLDPPGFLCKMGGSCQVDVKTRSRCQRCRYNRCLQAGMKAEYVLNESERKKRFRNSNSSSANQSEPEPSSSKCPSSEATSDTSSSSAAAANSNSFHPLDHSYQPEKRRRMAAMGPSQPQLFASHDFRRQQHLSAAATASGSEAADLALSERSSLPAAGVASSSRTSNTYQGQDAAAAAVMMRKETQEEAVKDFMMSEKPVQTFWELFDSCRCLSSLYTSASVPGANIETSVRRAWTNAYKNYSIDPGFIVNLTSFHLGVAELNHKKLWVHLNSVGRLFKNFAEELREFQILLEEDQRKLVHFNKNLFIQYLLCQYFNASTGKVQIGWILLAELPDDFKSQSHALRRVCISNMKLMFFEDQYLELCHGIQSILPGLSCSPMVASLILFNTRESLCLDQRYLLNLHYEFILSHLSNTCLSTHLIEPLISTLDAMNKLYQVNCAWNWEMGQKDGGEITRITVPSAKQLQQPKVEAGAEQEKSW